MSTSGIPILFFLCFFPKKIMICGQRLYIILCLLWPIATTKTWPTILFVLCFFCVFYVFFRRFCPLVRNLAPSLARRIPLIQKSDRIYLPPPQLKKKFAA